MFILPNGKVIKNPIKGKTFIINDIQHPEMNLIYWTKEKRESLGIREYIEKKYDSKNFNKVGENKIETNSSVTIVPVLEPRIGLQELVDSIKIDVKNYGMNIFRQSKNRKEELEALNPDDPEILEHDLFKIDLKKAYDLIETNLNHILNNNKESNSKYKSLIDFDWMSYWPDIPGNNK